MNVFELFGTIAIDHTGAEKGIDKTVGHAKDAENALEKTFKRIGTYVAAAFSVKAIVDFGKACTQVYADVAAEQAAFEQVMGDYASTAQAKLEAVASQTGITSTRMTGAFNSLTAKFKGLGYNVEDATTLAADGLLIAADASAFWNVSLDEAMSHLNSFVNGSYEGGEAIGLFANDTQMAAYAVEQGIVATTAEWSKLDEATKQATRLDYAKRMQENSSVTGQAAKEADAYQNVLGNLTEAWRQFQAIIGKPILERLVLPAMRKLNEIMPVINESAQKGIDWLLEGFDKVAAYFSEVFTEDGMDMNAFPSALKNMFRDAARAIPSLLASVGRSIRSAWVNTVWPAVQSAFKVAFGVKLPEWSEIETAVITWWDGGNGIAAKIAEVCNWTLNLFGKPAEVTAEDVKTVLDTWWTNAKGLVEGFCDWTLKMFENPVEGAEDAKNKVLEWWGKVKTGAESALEWTLQLFGVPKAGVDGVKNLVSAWWSGVKTAAENALNWTLQLFKNPKETAGQVATKISTWWATVVSSAQSVLNWALKLFTNPVETGETIGDNIATWWAGVKADAESALIWTLQLFGMPIESTSDIEDKIRTWWSGVVETVQGACTWVLNLFNPPEDGEDGTTPESIIKTWWAGVVDVVQEACKWTLNIFATPGESVAVKTLTDWWNAIIATVQPLLTIDLSGIDVSSVFDAGTEAIQGIVSAAETLYAEILNALETDKEGKIKLDATLSNLFDAGVNAAENLLTVAGNLVGNIVGAITGDEEAGEKIGKVFKDMFGWASEIVIGVKEGAIEAFQWLIDNDEAVVGAFTGIGVALLMMAAANPAIAVLGTIISLIAVMTTDWEHFEENYPQLSTMLEDLTGLDFTDAANSLDAFKSTLEGIFGFLEKNSFAVDMILMLAGAVAIGSGHLLMGAALITAGGYGVWDEAVAVQKNNLELYGEPTTPMEDYLYYAMQMYKSPAEYGFTESELDAYIDVLRGLDPSAEGYREVAEAVVDAWMRVNRQEQEGNGSGSHSDNSKNYDDDNDEPKPDYDHGPLSAPLMHMMTDEADLPYRPSSSIENFDPGNKMLTMLQAAFAQNNESQKTSVQEGIITGMSGMTVQVDVTAGNVTLQDGTIIGRFMPKINAALGALAQRSGRTSG